MIDYRFPDTAVWHKNIISNDSEQMRAEYKGVAFKCATYSGRSKNKVTLVEGSSTNEASVVIRTPDKRLKDAEADDLIIFKGQEYSLDSVGEVPNLEALGRYDYVLYLK